MPPAPSLVLLAAFLAACSPVEDDVAPTPRASEPPVAMSDPPAPQAAPSAVAIVEQNGTIDFAYRYPAEAAAVDAIDARFREQAAANRTEIARMAAEEKAMRAEMGLQFHGLSSSTEWTTAGRSDELLSLEAAISSYTGGAHPNSGTAGLLWDRVADEEVQPSALFGDASAMTEALHGAFCEALDIERDERRGGAVVDGMFGDCPPLKDISIIPTDGDRDGRFDQIVMIADPYVAGSYAEGEYRIALPVDATLRDKLAPRYADGFEIAR